MYALKNKVQLIGNLGNAPEVKTLESGKKWPVFPWPLMKIYRNAKGEKVTETQCTTWLPGVRWPRLLEKFLTKGNGSNYRRKVVNRSYNDKEGNKKYVTEIQVNELLMRCKSGVINQQ
ncbi:MAG: single-stranded DNA-binding protein [Chitinophagaceae bacterium]|nr:single-stranded DNA-binding protein [Chitinophagaceae bacterium]